jgi:hypothetical protein
MLGKNKNKLRLRLVSQFIIQYKQENFLIPDCPKIIRLSQNILGLFYFWAFLSRLSQLCHSMFQVKTFYNTRIMITVQFAYGVD